jgi:hypothetical protein
MLRITVLCLFLLICRLSFATFIFSDNCKKAYTHIFNLKYEEAKYLINIEELYNPVNPSILFLNSGIYFMKSVLEEDPEAIKLFFEQQEKLISELNKTNENELEKNWLLAETYFHSSLINFKTGHYMQGVWQLRKSYRIARKHTNNNNPLFYKISGLTETFLSTVPDEYQWALKMFGMKGDLQAGTEKLYKLYDLSKENKKYNFILPEILFHIAYIEGNLLGNINKALNMVNENRLTSPLIIYIHSSLLMRAGKSRQAENILGEKLNLISGDYYPFPYMLYMLGMTKLQNLDYSASEFFQKYISEYKGNHFIKASCQKLAWIALLNNDLFNYNNRLNNVLIKGNKETDEDRQAYKEAEKKEIPEVNLLKSRLLFDGGNYKEAEIILSSLNIKSLDDKHLVEYYYRSGRIQQELKEEKSAETNFKMAIDLQGEKDFYFAANAALQIAIISEQNKNYKKAEEYYTIAYSYKHHEYKNSIQQKAKAGIKRIQKLKP